MHFTKQTATLARAPFGCRDKADSSCLGGMLCPRSGCPRFHAPAFSPRSFDRSAACWRHLTLTILQFEVALSCSAKNPTWLSYQRDRASYSFAQSHQPLVSLKAQVLTVTTGSCVIWSLSSLASAPTTLSSPVCVRLVVVREEGGWVSGKNGDVGRGVLVIFLTPQHHAR